MGRDKRCEQIQQSHRLFIECEIVRGAARSLGMELPVARTGPRNTEAVRVVDARTRNTEPEACSNPTSDSLPLSHPRGYEHRRPWLLGFDILRNCDDLSQSQANAPAEPNRCCPLRAMQCDWHLLSRLCWLCHAHTSALLAASLGCWTGGACSGSAKRLARATLVRRL